MDEIDRVFRSFEVWSMYTLEIGGENWNRLVDCDFIYGTGGLKLLRVREDFFFLVVLFKAI